MPLLTAQLAGQLFLNQGPNLTIPDIYTSIDDRAFYDIGLTSVDLGNKITAIGDHAFEANGLKTIKIPDTVVVIGDSAFAENLLTSVEIGVSVTTIGDSAFEYNKIETIIIPDKVTEIQDDAFYGNQLQNIIFGNSVTTIGDFAFGANQLTSIDLSDSLISIGYAAFEYNQLSNVEIPDTVVSIGGDAFDNNPLSTVTIPADAAFSSSVFPKSVEIIVRNENPDAVINSILGKGKLWGTREANQFTFDQFEPFSKKTADLIVRFKPSHGDTIGISATACPSLLGADEITFATARNAKEAKRLSRQDIDFVYFQDRGRLFFNGNGAEKGWGGPDEGGIFAFMHKKPELSAEDFTLLA